MANIHLPAAWLTRKRFFLSFLGILAFSMAMFFVKFVAPKARTSIPDLSDEGEVVGRWRRVSRPRGSDGWRVFKASGEMEVCYGDVIYVGSYVIRGKRTLETTYRFYGSPSETHLWTFGFDAGHLIMINRETGWVEEYSPVP